MSSLDRARVRAAFSRGAAHYDGLAAVQRHAADRLVSLARPRLDARPPRRVLDVGAGTGALLGHLAARWPSARPCALDLAAGMVHAAARNVPAAAAVQGDAERLPFTDGAFDLVVSTSALQWLPDLGPALAEAARVLAPGGTLAVALFGGETLHELRGAWREALPPGAPDGTHRFHAPADLSRALRAAGLRVALEEVERVVERHEDPLALLRALKRLGASTVARDAAGAGLAARGRLERMAQRYTARHGGPDGVPATWEILYAVAAR